MKYILGLLFLVGCTPYKSNKPCEDKVNSVHAFSINQIETGFYAKCNIIAHKRTSYYGFEGTIICDGFSTTGTVNGQDLFNECRD